MAESVARPKTKRGSRNEGARKSAAKPAKVDKHQNAGARADGPAKPGANARPGAKSKRTIDQGTPRPSDERTQLGDWRADALAEVRRLIREAAPDVVEERKWIKPSNPAGVPVWSHGGIICTGESYKQVVKLTFARGASLPDPAGLFNASLEGNARRAIDIREGQSLEPNAFKALIRAAIAENLRFAGSRSKSSAKADTKPRAGEKPAKAKKQRQGEKVVLLSGGNPQIAKADGDAPVQRYIAALPGWKRDLGKRLDALITREVPNVRKAINWNSPFYGVEGQGWFLSFHVFTRYLKVTFFSGTALRPIPPGHTERTKDARWIDIHENDELDEAQMSTWVKQAAALPGWLS